MVSNAIDKSTWKKPWFSLTHTVTLDNCEQKYSDHTNMRKHTYTEHTCVIDFIFLCASNAYSTIWSKRASLHSYFRFTSSSLFGLVRDKFVYSFFSLLLDAVDDITEMRLTVRVCTHLVSWALKMCDIQQWHNVLYISLHHSADIWIEVLQFFAHANAVSFFP